MRANATIIPPSRGMAPPHSPVPAPRPTTGTPNSCATFTIATTSAVERGKHNQVGPRLVHAAIVLVQRQVFGAVEVAAGTE